LRRGSPPALEDPPRKRILLASEGRAIPESALEAAARLAKEGGVPVRVFSIARIWGTGLGMPMPGLLPTRREWEEQRGHVAEAVNGLRRRGVKAEGQVIATRKAGKRIVREAELAGCDVIVMGASPPRHWFVGDFLWSQEPQRVRRRAKVPVVLVEESTPK